MLRKTIASAGASITPRLSMRLATFSTRQPRFVLVVQCQVPQCARHGSGLEVLTVDEIEAPDVIGVERSQLRARSVG